MSLKIYLAGPMRGIPEYNSPAFIAAAMNLRGLGYGVSTPIELDRELGFDWTGFKGTDEELDTVGFDMCNAMRRNYRVLTDWADSIAFLPGWTKSRGSLQELLVANSLNLQTFEYFARPTTPLTAFRTESHVEISTIRYQVPVR